MTDSTSDHEFIFFCAAKAAADIIFEHVKRGKVWMEDRRRQDPNSFYGQLSQGLMLKMYYSLPSTIMTPWGEWGIGGSGSGNVDALHEAILNDLGAVLSVPVKYTTMGVHGPVYSLRKAGGYTLPKPSAKPQEQWLSYEDSKARWATLLQRYGRGERADPVAFAEWDTATAQEVPSDTIKLRTGVETYKPMLLVVTTALRHLLNSNPIAFYEVVMLARNPNHKMFGNTAAILEGLKLLVAGRLDNSTRDIILASVDGEGTSMQMVNSTGAGA